MNKFTEVLGKAIYNHRPFGDIEATFNGEVYDEADYIKRLSDKLDNTKVRIWREDHTIPLPTYSHNEDAGCDVYVKDVEYDNTINTFIVHTGIHIDVPEGYELELRPRSNIRNTNYIFQIAPGTVDCGYSGEITFAFKYLTPPSIFRALDECFTAISNFKFKDAAEEAHVMAFVNAGREELDNQEKFPYKRGDRAGQILIRRREKIIWEEVPDDSTFNKYLRGDNGFGSTGGCKRLVNKSNHDK